MKLKLEIQPSYHDSLFYHCMAHLDLSGDAANLHSNVYVDRISARKRAVGIGATTFEREAGSLTRMYRGAPNRISFQALPLNFSGPEALSEMSGFIRDRAGDSEFSRTFLEAMEAEHRFFYDSYWEGEAGAIGSACAPFAQYLEQEIPQIAAPLFTALRLELRPCPAMQRAARALLTQARSITIASGIPGDADERAPALFQILHEATHCAIDRMIVPRSAISDRDTHLESDGYHVHWLLEQVVLAADYHLIRRHRPALLEQYVQWSAAWVIPERGPDPVVRMRDRAEKAGVNKPSSDWQALARVAPTDRLRAAEAALEDFILVPDSVLAVLEDALAGRSTLRGHRAEE